MHTLKIQKITQLNHNVRSYQLEKPEGYSFEPGQAAEVAINKEGWKDEARPFTFTSLPENDYLEFTIKSYFDHDGMTNELFGVEEGDSLLVGYSWGAITYNGPGVFIAGGAGITPFISILRMLKRDEKLDGHKLYFSNSTDEDVFLADEFEELLGDDVTHIITDQEDTKYRQGFIDEEFLEEEIEDTDQQFYVCGPVPMVMSISNILEDLGADPDGIVFEE